MPRPRLTSPTGPLGDLELLARTNLKPQLYAPRRVNEPVPPSLAASRLPPPCAEIDERPRWRYRRFRLWNDAVVSLRRATIDPHRRAHLRRYQSFAIPANPVPTRGSFATRCIVVKELASLAQPVANAGHEVLPQDPGADPHPRSYTPAPCMPTQDEQTVPPSVYVTPKLPKAERKARRLRLLQFQYALDQEYERRYRAGMRSIIPHLVNVERQSIIDPTARDIKWREDVDLEKIINNTVFFREVRKNSDNVWDCCEPPISPVARRAEIHEAVRKQEAERASKKERKRQKLANQKAAVISDSLQLPSPHMTLVQNPAAITPVINAQADPAGQTATKADSDRANTDTDHGELTDATTASTVSVRTPPTTPERSRSSSRSKSRSRPKPNTSQSAPVSSHNTAGSITTTASLPKSKQQGKARQPPRSPKPRMKHTPSAPAGLQRVSPPQSDTANSSNNSIDGTLPVEIQQVLANIAKLKIEGLILRNKLAAAQEKGAVEPTSDGERSTLSSASGSSRGTRRKGRRHGRRTHAKPLDADKAQPEEPHTTTEMNQSREDEQPLGESPSQPDAQGIVSSDRIARLADLQEIVHPQPTRPASIKEITSESPAVLDRDVATPVSFTDDSDLSSRTLSSLGPVFADLNLDSDTAAPFASVSNSERGLTGLAITTRELDSSEGSSGLSDITSEGFRKPRQM